MEVPKICRRGGGKEILEYFLFCMYLGSFTLPYLSTNLNEYRQLNGKTLQVLKNYLGGGLVEGHLVEHVLFLKMPKSAPIPLGPLVPPDLMWP